MTGRPVVLTVEQAAAMIDRHEQRQRRAMLAQRLRLTLPMLRLVIAIGVLAWAVGLI